MTAHFTLPREIATDSSNNPVSGAKLYFFDVGTTNPRTVYQDYGLTTAHGVFVQADANGVFDPIYPPNGDYDVLMTDGTDAGNVYSNETVLRAKISTQGPVDLTAFQTNSAKSETPAITKATDYTIVEADRGKAIDVNPNSATVTITLESAAVAGDGTEQTIKHIGASNAVLIATVGGENIDDKSGYALVRPGSTITVRSNGAEYKTKSEYAPNNNIIFPIAARTLLSPPTSPNAGDMYIMPTGTLTGLWSGFSAGNLITYLGSGGYQLVTVLEGDRGHLKAEGFDTVWDGSAWVDHSNTIAPQASVLKTAIFEFQAASNTDGGSATINTWATVPLNYEDPGNNIDDVSFELATKEITFAEAGKSYLIKATQTHAFDAGVRASFRSTTTSKAIESISGHNNTTLLTTATIANEVTLEGVITPDEGEVFTFSYYRKATKNNKDLGRPLGNGDVEIYGRLTIIDLASLQGPPGVPGDQGSAGNDGADGLSGYNFTIDTDSTTMEDPGAGIVRFNNAALSSVTAIALDDSTADSGNPDIAAIISTWDDSTSTIKGFIRIVESGAAQNFALYSLSAVSSDSGWKQLTVTYVGGNGSFSDADSVKVEFLRTGDKGTVGDAGPIGITWIGAYNAGTTYAINDGVSEAGSSYICTAATTGNAPPNASYWDLVAEKGSDGAGTGDVVGPASSTDNAIARYDTTTGKLLQNSAATIDDSGNFSTSGTVNSRNMSTDGTKLDAIEASADVTDETNVKAALDGATLTAVTVATGDKVLVQDVSDSDNVKTVTAQSIADLAAAGSSQISAWINYNSTGTISIIDSYNISSITDNGAGDITINFATALANADYGIAGSIAGGSTHSAALPVVRSATQFGAPTTKTTSACRVLTYNYAGGAKDPTNVYIVFFGGV